MRTHKMLQAESMRYAKIQRQIDLLCEKEKTILDDMAKVCNDVREDGL